MSTTPVKTNIQTLDTHTKNQQALLQKKAALDNELNSLIILGTLTSAQKARQAEINIELDQISVQMIVLTKESETISTDDTVRKAAKQDLYKQITATLAPPPPGAITIIHGTPAPDDMISYMKFTQYLNPYGRKRQCDSDLENLMAIVNKDLNNAIGENQELVKKIAETIKQ
jgi:hypothetical protein